MPLLRKLSGAAATVEVLAGPLALLLLSGHPPALLWESLNLLVRTCFFETGTNVSFKGPLPIGGLEA